MPKLIVQLSMRCGCQERREVDGVKKASELGFD